jgi:quercetin dioxygenase-like cupin family protein
MQQSTHTTTGTDRRDPHTLSGEHLVYRLADEIADLRQDLSRSTAQRSAKTLAKIGGLRVTLVYMEANSTMSPEAIDGGATLQVIEGRLRVQADGNGQELGPGEVIVLERNLREPVQSVERSAFLLTVVWPAGAGAWSQEEAAGRL